MAVKKKTIIKKSTNKLAKIKAPTTIENLMKMAKSQGFITQEDILMVMPRPELHLADLDRLYDRLISAGVDVFEEVFKLIFTKLYDELQSKKDKMRLEIYLEDKLSKEERGDYEKVKAEEKEDP